VLLETKEWDIKLASSMPLCIVFLASGASYIKHEVPRTAFRWSLSGHWNVCVARMRSRFDQWAVLFSWGLNLNVHFSDFLNLVPSWRILVHKRDPHAVSASSCFHQCNFDAFVPNFVQTLCYRRALQWCNLQFPAGSKSNMFVTNMWLGAYYLQDAEMKYAN
jgi:hypothetical protein